MRLFDRWMSEAHTAREPEPEAVAFVTVGQSGRPSARTVLLKRVERDALVFTSALWTRKARELRNQPVRRTAVSLADRRAPGAHDRDGPHSPSASWPWSCSPSASSPIACRRSSRAGRADRGHPAAARSACASDERAGGPARVPAGLGSDTRTPRGTSSSGVRPPVACTSDCCTSAMARAGGQVTACRRERLVPLCFGRARRVPRRPGPQCEREELRPAPARDSSMAQPVLVGLR